MVLRIEVVLVTMTVAVFQIPFATSQGSVEMISDYAKVAKQADAQNLSSTTTEFPPDNSTDLPPDYEDFDDLQEEDRSMKQSSSTDTMMNYFKGIVSLLALMYKFNGKPNGAKPQKLQIKNPNEPRKWSTETSAKKLYEAQDRFEFPQKKFRYHGNDNSIDQQFQPLENYPPYNPLEANSAETYNRDDLKTSYDSDSMQYDSTKANNVEIQQSYSYEIPYETPKPVDSGHDEWKNQIHPVYQPWTSSEPQKEEPSTADSYQNWMTQTSGKDESGDSYMPWKTKTPNDGKPSSYWKIPIREPEPTAGDTEPRQPWKGKFPSSGGDFPVYHQPHLEDHHHHHPEDGHHFEYHEVEPEEEEEDRMTKKPYYSYYFLGRKLWYIPLLFSVYFIIYVGALVLKSVARHKIQFPEKVWNLHEDHFDHNKHRRQHRRIDEITENYEKAIEKSSNKFM